MRSHESRALQLDERRRRVFNWFFFFLFLLFFGWMIRHLLTIPTILCKEAFYFSMASADYIITTHYALFIGFSCCRLLPRSFYIWYFKRQHDKDANMMQTFLQIRPKIFFSSGTDEVRAKRDPSLSNESVNGHFWSNLCLNCIFKWT